MITKDPAQIKSLKQGGRILASVLNLAAERAVPGVSAYELDQIAEKAIAKAGATASFKNYRSRPGDPAFPASLCVSINDEVVHGVPHKKKILKSGDIVGLDLGVWYDGLCTDAAITVGVGKIGKDRQKLISATKQALHDALAVARAGARIGDIGHAIQTAARKEGFDVVRELVGHGVGKGVHEDPEIPCFGKPGTGEKLLAGMVLAIEPMLVTGHWKVKIDSDNWTIKTYDGGLAGHFEHTVLVTADGCEILTEE